MEWSTMRTECYRSLTSVTDYLLRLELDQTREAQLEAALGVFYAPPRPLSDSVVLEYRGPISKYARRFFHHLLRHQRFEKAFLLAVDIGARDLFMVSLSFPPLPSLSLSLVLLFLFSLLSTPLFSVPLSSPLVFSLSLCHGE
uniref:WD repeat-containing and planar cell polarity effector protein fritz homolog n=1 Tax=Salmo trutta TaxID=8032 RepID=A0A673Z785_SALTR